MAKKVKDVYFDSFGIEYMSQEVLSKIESKSITQAYLEYNLMILLFMNFIVLLSYNNLKALLDYTNVFSPNDYKKNGKIIYKYFKDKYDKTTH